MEEHLTGQRQGFAYGYTAITDIGEHNKDTGIAFGILSLRAGESLSEMTEHESAYLLLSGRIELSVEGKTEQYARASLFDEGPCCVHVPCKTLVSLHAFEDTELAIQRVKNEKRFPVEWYGPRDVANENRGAGQVDGACWRWVRTIFDDRNSSPDAELVLGEVVTMPGRWSSYPPHHHPQPEIYHYRFSDPRGFGNAQLGEDVVLVRQYDTVKILDEKDHAQCAAPGYAMYYVWVIRHLPACRYSIPEFTEDHRWTMEPDAEFWLPEKEHAHGKA
ncbi:MAG: 5-deoxy-glucuronate isomerase [Chlamydiia bacterium]|nr:5-deoxy-glucuronate isomerase [Chlamydiia bacterium]